MPLNPSVEISHADARMAENYLRHHASVKNWQRLDECADVIQRLVQIQLVKEVWVVHYMNMEPAEVDSIHATEESAEKRHEILGPSWHVDKWTVTNDG